MTNTDNDPQALQAQARLLAELLPDTQTTQRELMLQLEKAVGNNVRIVREQREWSQAELAERMGAIGFPMHQTTIAKLEGGGRPIRLAELFGVAHVFGMPAIALLLLNDTDEPATDAEVLAAEIADIERAIEDDQQSWMRVLNRMVDVSVAHRARRDALIDQMRELTGERDDG